MSECKICLSFKDTSRVIKKWESWILREAEPEKNCPGYFYLEPIRHVESFAEFTPSEWAEYALCMEFGMKHISENFSPRKIYLVTISEAVPHIHFHLVPRYVDSPRGFDYLSLVVPGKWVIKDS